MHRFYTGTLNADKATDIDLAAPMILDALRHNDVNLLNALFNRYMAVSIGLPSLQYLHSAFNFTAASNTQQSDTSKIRWDIPGHFDFLKTLQIDASKMKDTYWHLLGRISRHALRNNQTSILSWVLDHYNNPLFPHFTKRQEEWRSSARHKKFGSYGYRSNKDKHPLPRQGKDDVFETIKETCHLAIRNRDRDLMVKSIAIMKNNYRYYFNQSKKDYKTPYAFFQIGILPDIQDNENPVPIFNEIKSLLQEADELCQTTGSWGRYIRANLVTALAHKNIDVVTMFKNEALSLNLEDREAIMNDRMHTDIQNKNENTRHWMSSNVFFNRYPDALNSFIDIIEQWQKEDGRDYKTHFFNYIRQYLERSYGSKKELSYYDIQSRFETSLKWSDIEDRLTLLRNHNKKVLNPISLKNKEYFTAALNRALEYGHADDFKVLCGFATEQDRQRSPKNDDQKNRGYHEVIRRHLLHRATLTRDKNTVSTLLKYLENSPKENTEEAEYIINSVIKTLVTIPTREDRRRENQCSLYSNGQEIEEGEYSQSLSLVYAFVQKEYDRRSTKESKKSLIESVFGSINSRDCDYAPFTDSFKIANDEKNHGAVSSLIDLWYKTARDYYPKEEYQRRVAYEFKNEILKAWKSTESMDHVIEMITKIKDYKADDAKAFFSGFLFGAEDHKKRLLLAREFPMLLSDEDIETLKTPMFETMYKALDRIAKNRDIWQDNKITIPTDDALYNPPTNFNEALYQQLLEPMRYYSKLESNGSAEFHAFKLSTLFVDINKISKYLHNHAKGPEAVHNACLFALPSEGQWNKELWGNLAIKWGAGALRWLSFAPQLEKTVVSLNKNKTGIDKIDLSRCKPADLRELVHKHCSYTNKDKNPDLARVLLDNGVDEKYFEESLDFVEGFKNNAKKSIKRALPNISIKGSDVGAPGYTLETIPPGDYRNLWMGQFVNSCVHLANQGRDLALAMFKGEEASAYAIKNKNDQIVGAFHSWVSKDGNLVLNSWQRRNADFDFLREAFLDAVADQALKKDEKIQRVVLGKGRLEKGEMPYELIEGNMISGIGDDAEINRAEGHFTADTEVGQFIITSRQKSLKL